MPPTPHNSCVLPEMLAPAGPVTPNHAATITTLLGRGGAAGTPSAPTVPATPQNSAALPAQL